MFARLLVIIDDIIGYRQMRSLSAGLALLALFGLLCQPAAMAASLPAQCALDRGRRPAGPTGELR